MVESHPTGYRLAASRDAVGAYRFELITERGAAALAGGEPERAAPLLREALALWHGPALADAVGTEFAFARLRGWRSCTWRRWPTGSTPTWRSERDRSWSGSCRRWSRPARSPNLNSIPEQIRVSEQRGPGAFEHHSQPQGVPERQLTGHWEHAGSSCSTVLFQSDTWHSQGIDANMLATSALLVTGTALFLVAQWRGWRPSLRTAMAIGIGLRVAIWALAVVNSWQPFDFADDFSQAAIAVLQHHDPLLTGRTGGWHFLPTMTFVLAGELWFCYATNLPWQLVGRLAPVLADLALIPLVGRLSRNRGRLRSFQYACNPVSIMICAIHGQIEPEMLALGAAAFAVAFAQRRAIHAAAGDAAARDGAAADGAAAGGAAGGRVNGRLWGRRLARSRLASGGRAPGILLGVSISMGTWSLLLLPGLLKSLPGWARRVSAVSWAIFVPAAILVTSPLTVGTPAGKLPSVVNTLINAQPLVGDWGWTAVATHGQQVLSPALSRPGMLILVGALLVAGFLWRRADPIDLTMALLIAFLIFSPRFGDQYLMWPLPFLIARKSRFSTPAILLAAAWMGLGEVYIGKMSPTAWQQAHIWWSYLSLAVIGALLLALAGISRRARPTAQPLTVQPVTVGAPAGSKPVGSKPAGSHPEGIGRAPGQRCPQQPDPEQQFPHPDPEQRFPQPEPTPP